jgi:chromosomal replication initiator protein
MSENNYEEAWLYAINEIKEEFFQQKKEREFILWIDKIKYVSDTLDCINVSVSNSFLSQIIKTKGYLSIVENKLKSTTCQDNLTLNLLVKEESISDNQKNDNITEEIYLKEDNISSNKNIEIEEPKYKKHPLLQEEYTFDTFIPGDNCNFAYNASLAVSKNPGTKFNPILLYGGSGLGKTHLMQAIGNYIYNHNEKLKICYISAESFTNEFIMSTKEKKTSSFKSKYRNLDVLLLDDIHFLQNKDATQEELFYTFNALHEKHAQMVFTCDRPIKEIKNMTARLVSRLSNGLCIDINPPNYETRCAILQKKVEQMNQELSSDIIDYIAKNVETNVRELEAALKQVFAYSDMIGKKPTLEIAKNQLKNIFSSNSSENVSLELIQKFIAEQYQISVSDLKSKKRDKKFVIPRQIAIYLAREIIELSYTEIGNEFGGKDHSTIMHSYEKISDEIKINPGFNSKIKSYIRDISTYKK